MRPDREGWWYSSEGEVLEICGVDEGGVQIWRDGELELHEDVGEGWLLVPSRQQLELMLHELRQLREELEALRKGSEGGR